MTHIEEQFEVSQRRACSIVGQPRSTQRLPKPDTNKEDELIKRIDTFVRENPRYGYRRITDLLRLEGWQINPKRVHRIWKQKGYRVPPARKKSRSSGKSQNACDKRKALFPNDVWAYDFIFDRLENGRPLKILAITDEYTRESIGIEVGNSITGSNVVEILNQLVLERGLPLKIRSDNGSEFICGAVSKWMKIMGVQPLNVEKASPWQNGYAESFNSRFRDECLNTNQFYTIKEATIIIKEWQKKYNEKRPHSGLGGLTPKEFARRQIMMAGICPTSDELPLGPFSVDQIPASSSEDETRYVSKMNNMVKTLI